MTNISKVYIGVDVSKSSLDIHMYPIGRSFKIKNSKGEIQKFIRQLEQYDIATIGCEATGGYEKLLFKLLKDNTYDVWIIDPRRIKGFIVASGCKSKTDKIDAKKIAEFVSKNTKDYDSIIKTETQEQLQSLVNRKQDLIKFLVAEKTRLQHPSHVFSLPSIKKLIEILESEVKVIDKQIEKLIASDKELTQKSTILESIPGIGKASAAALLSFVPELGKIGNNKISALVGVCPYDNASGTYTGKKSIRGGRLIPRNMLYMCALTTIKYNLILKSFYDRLIEHKKPFKVAIVAVMRKLIVLANSLLKKGELCKV
jgi:transposase